MQHQGLPVQRHLEVAVEFPFDTSQVTKEGVHVVPGQIVRNRVLEYGFVGAQMGTGEFGDGIHSFCGESYSAKQ